MSKFLKILLVCVICCQFGFIGAVGLGGGAGGDVVPVARTTGLQTNMVEIARFDALWDAAGQAGDIDADRDALLAHANSAIGGNWIYTMNYPAAWESDDITGRCEPIGVNDSGNEFNMRNSSTDTLALALYGAVEEARSPGAGASFFAGAAATLREVTYMSGFEPTDISGSNQCILDLGTAVPNWLEAAWLLEDAGYASWTEADRLTLAQWARDEVFYLVSWGVQSRKNNWGIVTFNAALAIAAYGEGLDGFDNITEWDTSGGQTRTPTQYLAIAGGRLNAWLDNSGNQMDSDCQEDNQRYGLQSYGGFPDELRRTTSTVNCNQEDLSFLCGPGQAECIDTSGAKFYQQKATNGLAHTCEILRRIDGNGARCFDLTSHDSDPSTREALYDAAAFSTTQLNTTQGIFQDYAVSQYNQGFRYVASTYYDDICMYNAYEETATDVRGGRDYPYTRITHREGVAHASTLTTSSDWSCAIWGEGVWSGSGSSFWDTQVWDDEGTTWAP